MDNRITTSYRIDGINEKIKMNEEWLTFVNSKMERNSQLTRIVVSKLSSFDNHFDRLENSVIPMLNYTKRLAQKRDTVYNTLFHLDEAISHHQVIRRTDKVLLMGPAGRVCDYVDCLYQIKRAIEFFQDEESDGPNLKTLTARLERARPLMELEFRVLVDRYCTFVSTFNILSMMAGESAGGEVVEPLPKTGLDNLNSIYTWLTDYTAQSNDRLRMASNPRTLSLDRNLMPNLISPHVPTSLSEKLLKNLRLKRISQVRDFSSPSVSSVDEVRPLVSKSSLISQSRKKPSRLDNPMNMSQARYQPLHSIQSMDEVQPLLSKSSSTSRSQAEPSRPDNPNHPQQERDQPLHSSPFMEVVRPLEFESPSRSRSQDVPSRPDTSIPLPQRPNSSSAKETFPMSFKSTFKKPSQKTSPFHTRSKILKNDRIQKSSSPVANTDTMSRLKTMSLGRSSFIKAKTQESFNPISYYTMKRSACLDNQMKSLKEHYIKCSVASWNHHSLAMRNKPLVESPFRKSKKTEKEIMLDIEIETYKECVRAFLWLAKREQTLLNHVFSGFCSLTFSSIIQTALDNLLHDGQSLIFAIKLAYFRNEYSVIFTILPAVVYFMNQRTEGSNVLGDASDSITAKVNTFTVSLRELVTKGLDGFADYVKSHPDSQSLPADGTVHELNRNTMLFLQQLSDYKGNAALMLPSYEEQSWTAIEVSGSAENIQKQPEESTVSFDENSILSTTWSEHLKQFSSYASKVLENLQTSLRRKAKVYKDPALSAIFILNNFNYILETLRKSNLISVVRVRGKDLDAEYKELIDESKLLYQLSWLTVTECLADRKLPAQKEELSEKDRRVIKQQIKDFNERLEEMCATQKGWAVPDRELRVRVCQEQGELVSLAYRTFLHKYKDTEFTKHPEKYLKYSPQLVKEMIHKLFDQSA